MAKYFTSDLHLFHENILKFSKRPFASISEMHEALITNWNSVVTNQDIVYLLGDVSFSKDISQTIKILHLLNGNIILVKGNHDERNMVAAYKDSNSVSLVKDLYEFFEVVDGVKYKFSLMHYPMSEWRSSHHGAIHLHGHCHGTMDNSGLLRIDVGTDCWNYTPVSLDQIVSTIKEKQARIASGEEPTLNSYDNRSARFKELYFEVEENYAGFMSNYMKYKEFYEANNQTN